MWGLSDFGLGNPMHLCGDPHSENQAESHIEDEMGGGLQGLKALVAILYVDVYPQPKKHKFNTKAVADGGLLVWKSIWEGGLATTYTRMHKRDGLSSCRSSGSPSVQL